MSPAGQPGAIVGSTDRLEIFVSEGSGRPTSKPAKELECVCGSAKFGVLARVRYERTQVLLVVMMMSWMRMKWWILRTMRMASKLALFPPSFLSCVTPRDSR